MLEEKRKKIRRHKRVRAKIFGTKERPRLCVFVSNQHIYAQLINDESHKTLAFVSDADFKKTAKTEDKEKNERKGKTAVSYWVGKEIAKAALENKTEKIVFDRGNRKYHGVVKALAEGAREGGLKF
ncbi:MAG: 50S ribosomal protein L18 [Candidatus Pacebacteria bacterium]|nr:50S ribosomal protein L18 [Candidatus Paceibacterota bacterium]